MDIFFQEEFHWKTVSKREAMELGFSWKEFIEASKELEMVGVLNLRNIRKNSLEFQLCNRFMNQNFSQEINNERGH